MQHPRESTADFHLVSIIRLGITLCCSFVSENRPIADCSSHTKCWRRGCWSMGMNAFHVISTHPLNSSLSESCLLLSQICKASNQYGELKLEVILKVFSYLSVHISPQHQVVNSGATGVFNCSISGSPDTQIEWFHNGKSIINDDVHGSSK